MQIRRTAQPNVLIKNPRIFFASLNGRPSAKERPPGKYRTGLVRTQGIWVARNYGPPPVSLLGL